MYSSVDSEYPGLSLDFKEDIFSIILPTLMTSAGFL